jgi:hypothetical protein
MKFRILVRTYYVVPHVRGSCNLSALLLQESSDVLCKQESRRRAKRRAWRDSRHGQTSVQTGKVNVDFVRWGFNSANLGNGTGQTAQPLNMTVILLCCWVYWLHEWVYCASWIDGWFDGVGKLTVWFNMWIGWADERADGSCGHESYELSDWFERWVSVQTNGCILYVDTFMRSLL